MGDTLLRALTLYIVSIGFVKSQIYSSCFDYSGKPQRCMPEFVNAAFQLPVTSTNTCGDPEIRYCRQTGVTGVRTSCAYCNAADPALRHPPSYLTDFNNNDNQTWWQSETMYEKVQYPNMVNLTINLGKSFDITYVRLKFYSSRPESFAIYKRTNESEDWTPYQFYSGSCEETYRIPLEQVITREDEQLAICTNDYSDISPLTGGNVAFSTLEGRPSAYQFESSMVLQEWVTATAIRIVLNRINTFGDEVFGDRTVLQSYYYAISDISIGGRCKCNGHASECTRSTGEGVEERLVCRCEHNTMGPDCGECKPFYNDLPWKRATPSEAHACQACECNGLSQQCYFDQELFDRTGRGGHCLKCRENADGPHCETCLPEHYRNPENQKCESCNCDPVGSIDKQCGPDGGCLCNTGITGKKCNQCKRNHFDFGPNGCRKCSCTEAGSLNNQPNCAPDTGICSCKEFVEQDQICAKCKPGYFGLDKNNPYGCISCFCYGHSSICDTAPGYVPYALETNFAIGTQRWVAVDHEGKDLPITFDEDGGFISVTAPGADRTYFIAPDRFLGDQRSSYDQELSFKFKVSNEDPRASRMDVVLEGNGMEISIPIFAQRNDIPRKQEQLFKFRLNEHQDYQWMPTLSAREFIGVLANLTAIKIRATYGYQATGYLYEFKLMSAHRGTTKLIRAGSDNGKAYWIEQCTCPEGYVGQNCESCAPGYRRDPPNGGPYARCIPCNCNGHSESCDVDTGRCICRDNTAGDNCEKCASGFYGYAMAGTPEDCRPCPCPDSGPCVELLNGEVACINCKEGFAGHRCDLCADGYFGDPAGRFGPRERPCEKCTCNNNIDYNAVANCNSTSGECLKCIYNTAGFSCEKCLPGYYGDALAMPKGNCQECACNATGSVNSTNGVIQCNLKTGQCPCRPGLYGQRCDVLAEDQKWDFINGGVEPCDCDEIGSINASCNSANGQCNCRPGITGLKCNKCIPLHFGFSAEGCQACDCDPVGSFGPQCSEEGQCKCKNNIIGRRCDRCPENQYGKEQGCLQCAPCYTLVQNRINKHRELVQEMRELLDNIGNNPHAINDTDFRNRLQDVARDIDELLNEARSTVGVKGPLADQLESLKKAADDIVKKCGSLVGKAAEAEFNADDMRPYVKDAKDAVERAEETLLKARSYLDNEGKEALRQAREAQEKFGQQSSRMTDIAKEARETAGRQEKEAMKIHGDAEDAKNSSLQARNLLYEVLQAPSQTSRQLNDLRQNLTDAERLLNYTTKKSDEAKAKADETYTEALDTYTRANSLTLPETNPATLKSDAENVIKEADKIKDEADRLVDQNADLMKDVAKQKEEAVELLNQGHRQQQIADELLADADLARAEAKEAVNLGEQTLKDANETLKTLQEFDKKVQDSKGKAKEALSRIPGIENQIYEAERTTREAENALRGAESDATMARDVAKQAEDLANMAADDAKRIEADATKAKERVAEQKEKANKLMTEADKTKDKTEVMEKQANEDEHIIRQALEKADEAKRSAAESSKAVQDSMNTVDKILNELNTISMVNTTRIAELEKELDNVEQELKKSGFTDSYNEMKTATGLQQDWIRAYTDELAQLRRDVDNIQAIKESLPEGCFRESVIEPPLVQP